MVKFWSRLKRPKISKRQKFALTAILLSAGLLAIQALGFSGRYQAIGVLTLLTLLLSAWSLAEDLKIGWWFLNILVLPTFFVAGVGLFYFLTPAVWLTRVPIILLFGLGLYVLLLTENIFAVAAIRTIQLLRSAQAVGFLLTVVTAFFLYDTILSFRLDPWLNSLLIGVISFPLILHGLWSINLEERIPRQTWLYVFFLSLVLAETGLILSFWPLTVAVGSLGLSTVLYIVLGLVQHRLSERLFKRTVNEYLGVGMMVLVIIFLTAHWGG